MEKFGIINIAQALIIYLKIITDFGNLITLDMDKARKRHPTILEKYQVYEDRSPDLR